MTERIAFLREETLAGRNKIMRRAMPRYSTAHMDGGIPVRKARAFAWICEAMPLYIGPKELIVGTRTFYEPHEDNLDSHDHFDYTLVAFPEYVTREEIEAFGGDYTKVNKQHYTPDFSLLLNGGIDGILAQAEAKKKEKKLAAHQVEFLDSLLIAYNGIKALITRYADHASALSEEVAGEEKERLLEISRGCRHISGGKPRSFREAVQLLWFGHLGTILESWLFINYGRLDVILDPFLGKESDEEAREILGCLLLKMYDQADINDKGYFNKHEGQLVVTLGGVLPNGENAASRTTGLFLDAISDTMLPEPEINLRLHSKNPAWFLEKASELTVKGANFMSYYNDDGFVKSLQVAGLDASDARAYAFDLCQDMNIPGKGDFYLAYSLGMAHMVMDILCQKDDFASFDDLLDAVKKEAAKRIANGIAGHNADFNQVALYRDGRYEEYFAGLKAGANPNWNGRSPMCPLPYLSGMYQGAIENATDMIYEPYPIKERGTMLGTVVEAINSLAAIQKVVFEDKRYTLHEVVEACKQDYRGEGQEIMRAILWNAPKWGNDDPFVDQMAKELIEFCLRESARYTTPSGGKLLSGIHQPHPVSTGWGLMATPEGRHKGAPVSVTMTPASGSMKRGATAAMKSASVFDPDLIQWNYCFMINYYASIFQGEEGPERFRKLLQSYFARGGMQHQPNVMDGEELKKAQAEPEKYKDLIVRMWGVSAHFVDLPKELQDEMIARLG